MCFFYKIPLQENEHTNELLNADQEAMKPLWISGPQYKNG